ncbi:MAG TPA: phytanoyl-CoA dioxygenase family protein [Alphaproteobacteria bacterium]|nr:phytanoyl-CoA dioxygenase family protein [Alphaproteobacteria bacterium]
MGKLLSEAQIAAFERDGYVSGIPVLAPDDCVRLERRIAEFEVLYPREVAWAFDIKCNLLLDWVVAAGTGAAMLDAVEDLIGPNILMTDAVFRIKEPGSSVVYDWHQDSARIQVEPCFLIGYLAVGPSTVANGCLEVIPGTHREVQPFRVVEDAPGQAERRVARVAAPDTSRARPLELAAGEVAFFSGNLIHSSGPNRAAERRIAILYDYTAAHARQSIGRGSGQLVRGRDDWHHFGHEPFPGPEFTAALAAERRRILRTYPENPLMGPREPRVPLRFPDAREGPYAEGI